jgi:hypothetical protein
MLNTMSSWLGGGGGKSKLEENPKTAQEASSEHAESEGRTGPKNETPPATADPVGNPDSDMPDGADPFVGATADLQEVSKQALSTAKTWGSEYLGC